MNFPDSNEESLVFFMVNTIQLSLVTSCLSAGQEYHVFRDEDIMGVIQEERRGEVRSDMK